MFSLFKKVTGLLQSTPQLIPSTPVSNHHHS